jgi:predicted MFS family arabinose efflux permease
MKGPAHQQVWPILLVAFLNNVTIGARVLIIPLYAAHLGQSAATVGLLYAAFAGVASLAALPAGFMIDRRGSRAAILGALLFNCAAQLLAITDSVPALFVSQVFSGISWATATLGVVTAALSLAPAGQTGNVVGLVSLGNQTGLMAGPAVAGILVGWLGFAHLLLLCALPPVVGIGIVLAIVGDSSTRSEGQSLGASSLQLLRRPGILPIALLAASLGIVWGTFQAYFAIFTAHDLHVTAVGVGVLIAIAGFANTLSRVPAGWLLDRPTSKVMASALGVTAFGAALVALPHLHSFWLIAALLAISVPLYGMALIGMSLAAAVLGGERGRGRTIGVLSSLVSLAGAAAPAVLAGVMNASFVAGFTVAGLSAAAIAGVALVIRRRVMRAAATAHLSHVPGSSL